MLDSVNRPPLCIIPEELSLMCSLSLGYLQCFWATGVSVMAYIIPKVIKFWLLLVWLRMSVSLVSRPHHSSEKEEKQQEKQVLNTCPVKLEPPKLWLFQGYLEEPGNINRGTYEKQERGWSQQKSSLSLLLTVMRSKAFIGNILLELSISCFLKNCTQSVMHLLVFILFLHSPQPCTISLFPSISPLWDCIS